MLIKEYTTTNSIILEEKDFGDFSNNSIKELNRKLFSIDKPLEVSFNFELETIPPRLFSDTRISRITMPNSVKSIGSQAFIGCNELQYIDFSNSLSTICNSAFHDCTSLEKIIFPKSLKSIHTMAFLGCTNLTDLVLPNSINDIKYKAFFKCDKLSKIIFPRKFNAIDPEAFELKSSPTFYISSSKEIFTSSPEAQKFYDEYKNSIVFNPTTIDDLLNNFNLLEEVFDTLEDDERTL